MNKIVIVEDEINTTLDDNIKASLSETFSGIREITINFIHDSDLLLECTNTKKLKLNIIINIPKKVKANLYEIKKDGKYKLSYKYFIEEKANLNICKICDAKKIKELSVLNLNGKEAKVNYLLKTISIDEENYELMVYHNAKNTESHIINNGVNIKDGSLKFDVSGFVPKNNTDCIVSQNNRIINLTDNKCTIRPNLFIDENDVIASHSAHIGKCNDDEMFYLMSRGIHQTEAENLIIKGFLLNGIKPYEEVMEKIINQYWR